MVPEYKYVNDTLPGGNININDHGNDVDFHELLELVRVTNGRKCMLFLS